MYILFFCMSGIRSNERIDARVRIKERDGDEDREGGRGDCWNTCGFDVITGPAVGTGKY